MTPSAIIKRPCARWLERDDCLTRFPAFEHSRTSVAFHEAGHFVIGAFFGLPQGNATVTVNPAGEWGGKVDLRDMTPPDPNRPIQRAAEVEAGLQLATWYLAGYQAEFIHLGFPPADGYQLAPTQDHELALRALSITIGHAQQREYCQEWARRLLLALWPAVERVACRLDHEAEVQAVVLLAETAAGLFDALDADLFSHFESLPL